MKFIFFLIFVLVLQNCIFGQENKDNEDGEMTKEEKKKVEIHKSYIFNASFTLGEVILESDLVRKSSPME